MHTINISKATISVIAFILLTLNISNVSSFTITTKTSAPSLSFSRRSLLKQTVSSVAFIATQNKVSQTSNNIDDTALTVGKASSSSPPSSTQRNISKEFPRIMRKSQLKGTSKYLLQSADDQIISSILSTAGCKDNDFSSSIIEAKHGVEFCVKCYIFGKSILNFGKSILNSKINRESRSRSRTDINTTSRGTSTVHHFEATDLLTEISELVYDLKKVNDIINGDNEEEMEEGDDKGSQNDHNNNSHLLKIIDQFLDDDSLRDDLLAQCINRFNEFYH